MKYHSQIIIFVCIFLLKTIPALGLQGTYSHRVSVTEEYTDNLFSVPENKEEEYITIISIGVTGTLLWEKYGVELAYEPSYSFYDEQPEFDTMRHIALLRTWIDITRNNTLEFRNTFVVTEDPSPIREITELDSDESAVDEDHTVRTGRDTYRSNTSRLRYTSQFDEFDALFIEYFYSILKNDDETLEDNNRHGPVAGLTYWVTPNWGIDTLGSYTKTEYERSDEYTGSPSMDFERYYGLFRSIRKLSRQFEVYFAYAHTYIEFEDNLVNSDYHIYNPFIGFEYTPSENLSVSFDVGFFVQDIDEEEEFVQNIDGVEEDETGLTSNVVLTKNLRKGSFVFTGAAGYYEAYFGAENLGLSKFYEAGSSVEYEIVRNLTGNIFANFRQDKYIDIKPERRDRAARCGIGLSYQYKNWLLFELRYTHRILNSTDDERDHKENRIFFRITMEPSQPYRITR